MTERKHITTKQIKVTTNMKILYRSISTYHKSREPTLPLITRQASTPVRPYQHELWDEADESNQLPLHVKECLIDAKASVSKLCAAVVHNPCSVDTGYTPGQLDAALDDANHLLPPDISDLGENYQPNGLPLVRDVLDYLQTSHPTLETQIVARALHAVKNAILLLHLHDKIDIDLSRLISHPREVIAAILIVNKYLRNLTQL